MPDYGRQESFKIQWNHRQDAKSNPFSSLSASVNFATSSYERNNLSSLYNPQTLTQSTRTSSVSWSTTFSSIGLSLSSTANLSQNMVDSTIAVTLPDLNISLSRFYPFKRKNAVGKERWYEKISMSYTGQLSNSINTKEDMIMKSNLIKDWRNGFNHSIPISGNFTLFNYLNVTPSFSFTDRMYTNKIMRSWDMERQTEVADTTYGFYNVYNWNFSVGLSTKLYGFWVPNRKIFGDKIQAIRHVITPSVSFSYAPDFGASRYGYWETYQKTDADGNVSLVEYSPFSNGLYGVPGKGKTGSVTFDVSNNIEMKIKSDKDSTGMKKISIIDELGANLRYNMAAKVQPWSDLTMRIRLKWWKNYTFNMTAVFATYAYELDANGRPYVGNHTEWSKGRFGRFRGTSQNISFTLTPEKLKKWFGGGDDEGDEQDEEKEGIDTDIESNVDDDMIEGQRGAKKKSGGGKALTHAMVAHLRLWYNNEREHSRKVQHQEHALPLQVHADAQLQRQHTHQRRMEHQFLQRLRLRAQGHINDNGVAPARPPLLQHELFGGSCALHELQLHVPLQRRDAHRRAQIRQAQRLQQRSAVVLTPTGH